MPVARAPVSGIRVKEAESQLAKQLLHSGIATLTDMQAAFASRSDSASSQAATHGRAWGAALAARPSLRVRVGVPPLSAPMPPA